jgi:hypothetical protein
MRSCSDAAPTAAMATIALAERHNTNAILVRSLRWLRTFIALASPGGRAFDRAQQVARKD